MHVVSPSLPTTAHTCPLGHAFASAMRSQLSVGKHTGTFTSARVAPETRSAASW
jgi:hypothetical protein